MAVDVKTPKGYRKAWNGGARNADSITVPSVPTTWCRDERLRLGMDEIIDSSPTYMLVHVLGAFGPKNIHAGNWILWGDDGRCLAVSGSEEWARRRIHELKVRP